MMCKMGTVSFPGTEWPERDVDHPALLAPRLGRLEKECQLNIWRSAGDLGKLQSACGLQEIPHTE